MNLADIYTESVLQERAVGKGSDDGHRFRCPECKKTYVVKGLDRADLEVIKKYGNLADAECPHCGGDGVLEESWDWVNANRDKLKNGVQAAGQRIADTARGAVKGGVAGAVGNAVSGAALGAMQGAAQAGQNARTVPGGWRGKLGHYAMGAVAGGIQGGIKGAVGGAQLGAKLGGARAALGPNYSHIVDKVQMAADVKDVAQGLGQTGLQLWKNRVIRREAEGDDNMSTVFDIYQMALLEAQQEALMAEGGKSCDEGDEGDEGGEDDDMIQEDWDFVNKMKKAGSKVGDGVKAVGSQLKHELTDTVPSMAKGAVKGAAKGLGIGAAAGAIHGAVSGAKDGWQGAGQAGMTGMQRAAAAGAWGLGRAIGGAASGAGTGAHLGMYAGAAKSGYDSFKRSPMGKKKDDTHQESVANLRTAAQLKGCTLADAARMSLEYDAAKKGWSLMLEAVHLYEGQTSHSECIFFADTRAEVLPILEATLDYLAAETCKQEAMALIESGSISIDDGPNLGAGGGEGEDDDTGADEDLKSKAKKIWDRTAYTRQKVGDAIKSGASKAAKMAMVAGGTMAGAVKGGAKGAFAGAKSGFEQTKKKVYAESENGYDPDNFNHNQRVLAESMASGYGRDHAYYNEFGQPMANCSDPLGTKPSLTTWKAPTTMFPQLSPYSVSPAAQQANPFSRVHAQNQEMMMRRRMAQRSAPR